MVRESDLGENDVVQRDLERWMREGDARAADRAARRIAQEWTPSVRRFLRQGDGDEVAEVLQEALVALVVPRSEGMPPRAMAPASAAKPKAWRRLVLNRFLIDIGRRQRVRRFYDYAYGAGLSLSAARASSWLRSEPIRPPPSEDDVDEIIDLWAQRRRVIQALPRLDIRRRVAGGLLLHADVTPWTKELARALGEPVATVALRLSRADTGEEARLRVLYPTEPLPKARESWRKTVARAVGDLKRILV